MTVATGQMHLLLGHVPFQQDSPQLPSEHLKLAVCRLHCLLTGTPQGKGAQSGPHRQVLCCFSAHPSQRERLSCSLRFISFLLLKEANQIPSYYACEHNGHHCFGCVIGMATLLHISWC